MGRLRRWTTGGLAAVLLLVPTAEHAAMRVGNYFPPPISARAVLPDKGTIPYPDIRLMPRQRVTAAYLAKMCKAALLPKENLVPVMRGMQQDDFHVVMETRMPSALIEMFNIRNDGQASHYLDPCAIYHEIALPIVEATEKVKQESWPDLRIAIIDHGHGMRSTGAENRRVGTNENEYTYFLMLSLASLLKERGFHVDTLDYAGPAWNKTGRLNYYSDMANRLGKPSNSLYFATHVNFDPSSKRPEPLVVWTYYLDLAERHTEEIARKIVRETGPIYCLKHPVYCTSDAGDP